MKSNFLKASVTLISGSILTQILAVLVSPVMTRIYSEAEIGEYTLILTAVSMFGAVVCGRYDMSIVAEENEKNVFSLIKLSFVLTLIISFLVSIGYTFYYSTLKETTLNWRSSFFWIFLLLFFTGIGNILIAYNNRYQEYKLMTSVQIVREVGRDVTLIFLGILKCGTLGLLISQGISVFLGLNRQAKKLKKNIKEIFGCKLLDIKKVARSHIKQPLYSVPASFANSFSYSALNLFISGLFGIETLAYYSMSFRMLGLPLNLLSVNVSKVFFEKAAREYDEKKNFRKSYLQTSFLLLLIAIPMVVCLMVFAPLLFEIFFGKGWGRAGYYVRYLAPMFGIRLVVSAVSPTMIICKKQNWELVLQSLFIAASVFVYIVCKNKYGIDIFLKLISILYSIIYSIYFIAMFKFSKEPK